MENFEVIEHMVRFLGARKRPLPSMRRRAGGQGVGREEGCRVNPGRMVVIPTRGLFFRGLASSGFGLYGQEEE